jgi:hypothetical protein
MPLQGERLYRPAGGDPARLAMIKAERERRQPKRKCLCCRSVFRAETRFMFMCPPCRRQSGGIA